MNSWIHKYLSDDDLLALKEEISKVENNTSGEIRLSLRERRKFLEKLYKPHELALKDFDRLEVWNTKKQTGLLIFVIFDEKYYDILADEGLFTKIPDNVWNKLEDKLKEGFRTGNYLNGILHIIQNIGKILQKEFPYEDDENELSDEIEIN